MGPRVRLAYDNGAGQAVGARGPDRGPRPVRAPAKRAAPGACATVWETGLDNFDRQTDNPDHLKGSNIWLSAASTSAGPRVSTPAPPPSSSGPPRPPVFP
ncbi:hypothetical protein GCM10023220_61440 [Streptomyces ziwulingensis]|uniref:Uncharacterized protein n=1 Tax=Streptomyces ziwulingensis TaxID=1045501 RepID=A0ABP9D0X8_9ACTN